MSTVGNATKDELTPTTFWKRGHIGESSSVEGDIGVKECGRRCECTLVVIYTAAALTGKNCRALKRGESEDPNQKANVNVPISIFGLLFFSSLILSRFRQL